MDVVIVGAGMAGLSCARELDQAGIDWTLVESTERWGGRVKTDEVDGFRLDHGFQVLLTAYPALRGWVDLDQLDLSSFLPGAQIWQSGRFHCIADPLRAPGQALPTLRAPMATWRDNWLIYRLRSRVLGLSLPEIWASPETSTEDYLREFGFSSGIIEGFFRPFFGGVFLEPELATSSRQFMFVYRMFSQGAAALPRAGMQVIPDQLAAPLDRQRIELNRLVQRVADDHVELTDGQTRDAHFVVLATDGPTTDRLLDREGTRADRATTCLYFALAQLPIDGRWLVLNGDGVGPINNLCFPSAIAPSYAPRGQHLASVTVLGQSADRLDEIRAQLGDWFGPSAREWRHLATYQIDHALPVVSDVGAGEPYTRWSDGVYVGGDHQAMPSLNGAIESGRAVAQAIRARL